LGREEGEKKSFPPLRKGKIHWKKIRSLGKRLLRGKDKEKKRISRERDEEEGEGALYGGHRPHPQKKTISRRRKKKKGRKIAPAFRLQAEEASGLVQCV